MDEQQTIEFATGCAARGLCPRCLNMGEQHDAAIDLFGVCLICGYSNKSRQAAEHSWNNHCRKHREQAATGGEA